MLVGTGATDLQRAHLFTPGMTVVPDLPFTRLVHIWSGFGTLAYVLPYRLVRARRW